MKTLATWPLDPAAFEDQAVVDHRRLTRRPGHLLDGAVPVDPGRGFDIPDRDLPTRPTKTTDSRSKTFGNISVELDAIPPAELRGLVEDVISQHMPAHQFRILKEVEASEREIIMRLVNGMDAEDVQ